MTDPLGITLPENQDFSRATFEEILFAVTGQGANLHNFLNVAGGSTSETTWFNFNKDSGSNITYRAFKENFLGVSYNMPTFAGWSSAVGEVERVMNPVFHGKIGLMDVPRLWDAERVVNTYLRWLDSSLETTKAWVSNLDSDDSSFKGKAAYAIQVNLKNLAFTFNDLHDQIMEDRKPSTPVGIRNSADALKRFGEQMAYAWWESNQFLFNKAHEVGYALMSSIIEHLERGGLYYRNRGLEYNDPRYYVLDDFGSEETAKEYIRDVMAGYTTNHPGMPVGFPHVSGDLTSKGFWDAVNAATSTFMRTELEKLDEKARQQFVRLNEVYQNSGRALIDLKQNNAPTVGSPNGPPMPGGPEIPDIDDLLGDKDKGEGDGKQEPPPNNEIKIKWDGPPPGGDGTNIPPPPGGDGTNIPPPPGGDGTNIPPPPGGDGTNVPPPPTGDGSVVPPPPTGNGRGTGLGGNGTGLGSFDGLDGPGGTNLISGTGGLDGLGRGDSTQTGTGDGLGGGGTGTAIPPFIPPSLRTGSGNRAASERRTDAANGSINAPEPGDLGLPARPELVGRPELPNLPGVPGRPDLVGGKLDPDDGDGWAPGAPTGDTALPPLGGNVPSNGELVLGPGPKLPAELLANEELMASLPKMPTGGGDGASLMPGGLGGTGGELFGGSGTGVGSSGLGTTGTTTGTGDTAFAPTGTDPWSGTPGSDGLRAGEQTGSTGGSSQRDDQRGGMPGMPFMPPMGGMGGMGGPGNNGGNQQERERQTWLSEDEKVWGTDTDVGFGVIGRPDADDVEADEPLAPTHVHVRSAAPRGRAQDGGRGVERTAEGSAN